MLNPIFKKLHHLFYHNSWERTRYYREWNIVYPSRRGSRLTNALKRTADFVYSNADRFFQGHPKQQENKFEEGLPYSERNDCEYNMTWELNQGFDDILRKDINEIITKLIPGFARHKLSRLYRRVLFYIYADTFDDPEPGKDLIPEIMPENWSRGKNISIREYHYRVRSKLLKFSDWLLKFYIKISLLSGFKSERKNFHLLGYFAPVVYDNAVNYYAPRVRGPDRTKLDPSFSFHIRI